MRNARHHSIWRRRLENILIVIITMTPLVVTIRYRWADLVLPLGTVVLLPLLIVSSEIRRAVIDSWNLRQRGAGALFGAATVAWIALSTFWTPDPTRAAISVVKAAGILFAALALDTVLKTISHARIFLPLVWFTTVAIFVAASTVLSGGYIHHLFGCCRNGMQPNITGAAVTMALFIWPCSAWLFLVGRSLYALIILFFAFILIIISGSGAAMLAFAAGLTTIGAGIFLPRVVVILPLVLLLIGFLLAPMLGELNLILQSPLISSALASFHAAERVQIWSFYADLFWHRPWIGFGFAAEKLLDSQAFPAVLPPEARLHPHNAPLQILFEFGIVGAVLLFSTLVCVVQGFYRSIGKQTTFAIAPLVAILTAALVNFGLWESWWLSVASLVLILTSQLLHASYQSRAKGERMPYRASLGRPHGTASL